MLPALFPYKLLPYGFRRKYRPQRFIPKQKDLKSKYDVVIIGGGGHALACAYYLARDHGITDVCILEKGYLAGGNTARNTAIIRSNYLTPEGVRFYEQSLKLYRDLSQDFDFNILYSERGHFTLAHTDAAVRTSRWRAEVNKQLGVDSELIFPDEIHRLCPHLNMSDHVRYPILGALYHPPGSIARHDAVAWGYARAADALGVDIIQDCEVMGFAIAGGRVRGVQTSKGAIGAERIGIVAAGHNSVLAAMAGVRLPLQSHPLQALVSEPVKPVHNCVVMSNAVHVYVSQSDKGELVMGAGIDGFNSYAQRGSFHVIEHQMAACLELFPVFSRLRMMRSWGGIVDVCPDASPIIGRLPVEGLYINGGWGTGGFKATPGSGHVFAWTLAKGEPHPLAKPFALERFTTGALIDEHGAAAVAH